MHDHASNRVGRRTFLGQGITATGVLASVGAAPSAAPAREKPANPVRIGVIGVGPRGRWHLTNLLANHPDVAIPAIGDIQEDRLKVAVDMVKKARGTVPVGYSKGEYDYRNLCERDDLDAVLIAGPVQWIGRMTIDALKAGRHVGHEVSGVQTEDECWTMVHQKEKSKKRVMLLENCCYGNETMMIYRMVKQGLFGEPYYAEGSYVHDIGVARLFEPNGKLSWRGELVRDSYGSAYPQHGLGSACKWLEINDGDRMECCQTMMTAPRVAHARAVAKFGPDSQQAKVDFKTGDFVTSLIWTAKGRMIRLDYGITAPRPYSRYYLLQGTKGCWDSRSGIFLEGSSPGRSGAHDAWEPLDEFQEKYQHPYWRKDGALAQRFGGHGGIDYYCIDDFVKMVREDREPWIDVYDAAAWSSLIFCSKLSLDRKGARVEMPDFTNGKWKDSRWRRDRMPAT